MKKTVSKITAIIISAIMLLTLASCGGKTAKVELNFDEICQKISESVSMPEETIELQGEDLLDYYGIESEKVAEYKAVQDACGYKDEIVLIKAVDESAAAEIESLLNEHIDYQKDSMKNYDPAQYEILGASEVTVNGVYVAMFISAEQSTMLEIYNSFIK